MQDFHIRYTLRVCCGENEWIESFPTKLHRSDWIEARQETDKLINLVTYIVDESTSVYGTNPEDGRPMWMCDCHNDVIAGILRTTLARHRSQ